MVWDDACSRAADVSMLHVSISSTLTKLPNILGLEAPLLASRFFMLFIGNENETIPGSIVGAADPSS